MVVTEIIGEAGKTADTKPIQDHLRESARQYLEAVTKVERDTAQAIKQLYESLTTQVNALREKRQYQVIPNVPGTTRVVPHYRDYL